MGLSISIICGAIIFQIRIGRGQKREHFSIDTRPSTSIYVTATVLWRFQWTWMGCGLCYL